MQHLPPFALPQVDRPFFDQIVPMIGERIPNGFSRSAIDLQAGAVPKANTLIATIHHNKVNRPRPGRINLRYKDPLTAAASVLTTCFNNHL
jgi:hypothetical protein